MLESEQKQCLSDLCGAASKNLFCHLFSLHLFLTGREMGRGGGGGVKAHDIGASFSFQHFTLRERGEREGGGRKGGGR